MEGMVAGGSGWPARDPLVKGLSNTRVKTAERPYQPLAFWGVIVLILIVSVPLHLGSLTTDVSWLITVGEKVLQGERLYVDILETNPPVPALLYVPAVVAGRLFDVSPELAVVIITYLFGLLTLALTGWILPPQRGRSRRVMLVSAAVVMFVLSSDAFAQRDFLAALSALPLVAVFIRHAESGDWPPLTARVIATILAALALAIKPPLFALPGLLVFLYYLWRTRSLAFVIQSGLLAAGVLAVLITAASLVWFPDYFGQVWPLIRDVYLPAKSHPLAFLLDVATITVIACNVLVVLLQFGREPSPVTVLLLAAATGFFAAYLIQGKWFAYQVYPAALFIFLATTNAVHERLSTIDPTAWRYRSIAMVTGLLAVGAIAAFMFVGFRDPRAALSDLHWARDFEHPSVMAIAPDSAAVFPLVRQFGGVWVGRTHSQWVARYTRYMLEHDEVSPTRRLELISYHNNDLMELLNDLEQKKPDVILVDAAQRYSWFLPELEAMKPKFLNDYAEITEEGRVRVLARRGQGEASQ